MASNNKHEIPMYLNVSKIMAYIMYAWVMIGVVTLGLRVFLLALSANAEAPFVQFIYNTSADYLVPFRGIFPAKELGQTGYLDVAALFAVIIYLFIGWGFSALIAYLQSKVQTAQTSRY